MSSGAEYLTAEQRFRLAFERLKTNKPNVLNPGSVVSQNNVAREAECDPSALRKSRFPSLIREIQAYIEINTQDRPSKRKELLRQRGLRADMKKRLEEVIAQRDVAQSQLISAQRRVIELTFELQSVKEQLMNFQSVSTLKLQD
ncbi:hypothetical protein H4C48_21320 [Pseudomonas asiatica]|uniref:hypothetical protein n=1 Tax=Pseudomonas asiatica TaxID=2219225 RepID=UPI0015FA9A8A|nr:hypothetical protein [Pseudomonas asiatica]MBA6112901.1 hypothetical protein [Pseudomonas asiatica]